MSPHLGKVEPEVSRHLIKQLVDYLITLALECAGESQGGGGGGGRRGSILISELSINQLKGLKSFSRRET